MSNRYLALDGLRGISAGAVILFHFCQASNPYIFPLGGMAVDFFFVLSGFVISFAYEDRLRAGMPVSKFAKLRLIRLYPMLVLGAALGTFAFQRAYSHQYLAINFFAALFFFPSPFSTAAEGFPAVPANPPEWTLIFEFFGNLCYAIVAPRLGSKQLGLALAIFFVWYELSFVLFCGENSGFSWPTVLGGIPRFGLSFGIGVATMRLIRAGKFGLERFRVSWFVLALVLVTCFSIDVPRSQLWLYSSVLVLVVFPVVVLVGSFTPVSGALASFCGIAGELSYPLYILQGGFVPHVKELPGKINLIGSQALALQLMCIVVYTVFVYVIWRFIDVPIRRRLLLTTNKGPSSTTSARPV